MLFISDKLGTKGLKTYETLHKQRDPQRLFV